MKKLKIGKLLSLVLAMTVLVTAFKGISFPVSSAEVISNGENVITDLGEIVEGTNILMSNIFGTKSFTSGKYIIDLAGYEWDGQIFVSGTADVTIMDSSASKTGVFDATTMGDGIDVSGGKITLDGVKVIGGFVSGDALFVSGGTVVSNNSILCAGKASIDIANASASVTVNGGTFATFPATPADERNCAIEFRNNASITLNGDINFEVSRVICRDGHTNSFADSIMVGENVTVAFTEASRFTSNAHYQYSDMTYTYGEGEIGGGGGSTEPVLPDVSVEIISPSEIVEGTNILTAKIYGTKTFTSGKYVIDLAGYEWEGQLIISGTADVTVIDSSIAKTGIIDSFYWGDAITVSGGILTLDGIEISGPEGAGDALVVSGGVISVKECRLSSGKAAINITSAVADVVVEDTIFAVFNPTKGDYEIELPMDPFSVSYNARATMVASDSEYADPYGRNCAIEFNNNAVITLKGNNVFENNVVICNSDTHTKLWTDSIILGENVTVIFDAEDTDLGSSSGNQYCATKISYIYNGANLEPSVQPTSEPTIYPTEAPTTIPTSTPTPTATATAVPTTKPTTAPTVEPTAEPTNESPITDFEYSISNGEVKITNYIGNATEVVIPSEIDGYIVQQISSNTFKNNTTIEKVVFPDTVETVGSNVFSGCTSLTYVGFNNKLTNIGNYMFSGCKALSEIIIPVGVTTIGGSAFKYCTALTKVELPDGLLAIDSFAFDSCTGITSIDIPDSVTAIGGNAFYGCSNLTSVKLPLGWTTLMANYTSSFFTSPFYNCKNLTEITVPEGMTSIPSYAFESCSNLKKITLPESLTKINSYAFSGCSGLTEIVIPENVTTIGTYAFSGCNGLVSLVLNENLETLSNYAFANCANLTAARVPKSVTSFGVDSFKNCSKLTIYCYSGSAAHMALENTSYTYFLLDEHEHEYETTIETAATCTRGGSQIKTCTICEYNYIELVEALGHEYSSADTAPNCTEKGYTTYTCTRCKDTYKDNYVDALGHTYGDWQIEAEPKCTTTGSKYQICDVCEHKNAETIAALGHSYSSDVVAPTCTKQGYTVHTCSVCKHSYKDTYVNANGHSYGDWIVDVAATVLAEGSQHRVCTVCEHTETQTIERVEIDIDTNTNYGLAVFTVVNAQTLEPISGAQIFISTEKDGENTFTTDSQGQVSVVLPIGKQVVSVYASGCLTRNLNVNIKAGINEIKQIGLSDMPTYDAEITSTLMTIEEIEKAGIDTSDPSNQHVYRYELKLVFEPEIDIISIISYFNIDGLFLGGLSIPLGPGDVGPGDTGDTGDTGDSDGSSGPGFDILDHDYAIQPGSGNGKGICIPMKDQDITVYPVSEYFYLIIRGEVRWLKEMFDVEMLVINNSMTDTLEGLTATLELPEGLSLAKMVDEQQLMAQQIDYIGEGESKSVHWYVRGDTAGSYSLKAKLEGMVMPFEEPIDDVFVAENKLQVWAGDALHLHFEFPNAAYHGEDYPIKITLTNVSDITLYNISHMVQIEQGMVIYYSDGSKKEKIELSDWFAYGVREFHPGDKIVIEASVNIFFESEIIQRELEKLIGIVDGIEQLVNAFRAIQTAIDATDALINCVSGCSKALDNFNFSSGGDKEKLELFKQLYSRISSLASSYTTSGNKTIDAAVGLANSGVNASMNAITSDPDEWLKNHSVSDIKDLLSKIGALENSIVSSADTSKKFDIYDSIRTAISAIPIRFALKNVIMTEDENNTTSIPWSYSVTDASVQYFGVSNVSKYLMSLTQAALGEVYDEAMPCYLQLMPGLDDPFNQDAAIQYIQATENEIAQFKAKDATGKVTFKAWVERNEASTYSLRKNVGAGDFLLSCDNETATYENGVLTFTGDGMISVTPQSQTGGTLYIEDSEGNIYTYVIDVVEEHTCSAGEQQVVIAPTADYDGFAVKCCSTCGDIIEIIPLYYENCCKEHNFSDWTTTVEHTCADAGVQIRTCTSCGTVEYQFIEMIDHTCEAWEVVKEATCSAEGEEKAFCSVCESEVTRTIEKTSHTEGEWIVSKEATAFEEGVNELYCSICETVIKTESIPMTDESFGYSEESEEKLIVGLPECVTPDMLIAHYDNMGLKVTVTDAEGEAVEYVGTGCKVYFGDVEYTVVLKGDTTGDGIIDIFDILSMLDYLNGEGTLEGVYKEAGLVVNEEEIDIFDALALLDHVNGDAPINP